MSINVTTNNVPYGIPKKDEPLPKNVDEHISVRLQEFSEANESWVRQSVRNAYHQALIVGATNPTAIALAELDRLCPPKVF